MNTVASFVKKHPEVSDLDIEHELMKRMKNRGVGVISWIKKYARRFRKDWQKQYIS